MGVFNVWFCADIPDLQGLFRRNARGATTGRFGDRQPRAQFTVGRKFPVQSEQKRILDVYGRSLREGARRHRDV